MYWSPKMHKEAFGARFIVVSKKCSANLISKVVSQTIFHQIQSFYDKSCFYFSFKQFQAIENSKRIREKIEKVNCKAKIFRDLTVPHFTLNYLILIQCTE